MNNEKLEWKNCTCCNFPTECRREELPERGCVGARTVWFCAICAHSDLGEMVRSPRKYFGKWAGEGVTMRGHLAQQRRDATWQTNLLTTILLGVPRLWQMLETAQGIVDAQAVNDELDADIAEIKEAWGAQKAEEEE